MIRKRLVSVALFACEAVVGMTAIAGNGSRFISRFDTTFAALDSLIFRTSVAADPSDGAFDGFGYRATTPISPQLDEALSRNTEAKILEGNSRTGLQLTGQAYWRPTNSFGLDDETGESRYRAKFQAELRWYILQSRLLGADGRRKVAWLQEDIQRATYEKERTDLNDFRIKEMLAQHYDSLTSGVLQHRVNTLRLLDEAQNYLLASENISSDELVRTLDDRMEAERKLAGIPGTYPPAKSLADFDGTWVTIDSAAFLKHVEATQSDMKILQLRVRLLEEQERNVSYWQTVNLAPFIRYSYYDRRHLPNSSNLDLGVTFTIPISGETSRKKQTLRTERAVLDAEQDRLSRRVVDKVSLIIAEIDRLNRASAGEGRRVSELKGYLAMRTKAYAKGFGEYNRLARAREYIMYVACLERMIEYQYRRDCLVADLQALLPDESVLRFCAIQPLRDRINQLP